MVESEEEMLMNLRPKTIYEKLLWERRLTKMLKTDKYNLQKEVEKLRAELKEFKEAMEKTHLGAVIAKNKRMSIHLENSENRSKKLKQDIEELMLNLVRLQTTGSINNKVSEQSGENN